MLNPANLLLEAADINTIPSRLRELATSSNELARLVALNPIAPPDLLAALASTRHDNLLLKSVTANPNTPVEQLLILGAEFPRELINNPVFTLLLLENPQFFKEMPLNTITSILRLKDIPEEYLTMAMDYNNNDDDEYECVLSLIANHPACPESILNKIVKKGDRNRESFLAAAFHINYQGNITTDQIDVFQDAITNLKFLRRIFKKEEFLLSIGIISETSLAEYLADKHEDVTELAQDSSTPTSTLEKLATQTSLPIRRQVYHNCDTTYSEIKKLCEKEAAKRLQDKSYIQDSREVLSFVLENFYKYNASKNSDPVTVKRICAYLSLEDNIDDNTFKELKVDFNLSIFFAFAYHPKTPAYILEHIHKRMNEKKSELCRIYYSDEAYNSMLVLLAINPRLPIHILFQLLNNNCVEVRRAAINNIQTNYAFYNQDVAVFLQQWEQANNLESSPDTLLQIAKTNYKNLSLCLAVAKNPSTPASILDHLAFHKSRSVRLAVTKNPNTTVDALVNLTKKRKGHFYIRQSALKALMSKDPKKVGIAIAEFVNSSTPSAPRFAFLLHKMAPVEFLEQHADSTSWLERYAVAQNPNTPQYIRDKLKEDINRIVRAAAHGQNIGATFSG